MSPNHCGDPQGFGGGASVGGGGGEAGLPQAVAATVNNHLIWFGYTVLAQIERRRSNFRPRDFGAVAFKFEPKNDCCNQEFGTKSGLFDKVPL